ncbi:MAG TPA: amino acid permease [Terriglobales bacterium]|nr:amino acid permease [Terriglobales bacterium]
MSLPSVSPQLDTPAVTSKSQPGLVRGLSLLDSVLLLVGGVIGSSIFLTAKDIAGPLPHPVLFLMVWVVGGVVSLFACFAFAELGAMFPDSGGHYVYLREAYGDLPAFLYGWMLFFISNGGTIAALGVASAAYLGEAIPAISKEHVVWAAFGLQLTRAHLVALAGVALVTVTNMIGLRRGAILQNIATWMKFAAMVVFVLFGLTIGKGSWSHFSADPNAGARGSGLLMGLGLWQMLPAFGVALIAVFWAYDGWVYITWVSGEMKDPQKNLPRAIVFGVLIVGAIYVAMNLVYLYALPIKEIASTETVARAAAARLFSSAAAIWLSILIAISCFGANASCILTGARVYFAMARDGVFFKRMAEVHPVWRTPAFSLAGQGLWGALLVFSGRYDQLYTYVMFMMVLSYLAGVGAMFLLRFKRPLAPRPYRCTGYPWLPGIYMLIGGAWAVNTLLQRPKESFGGLAILLVGVPCYIYWKRAHKKSVIG